MSGQFPLRVSPSGPFENLGEPSILASLSQFSKFGTGITGDVAIYPEVEVVAVDGPIPNTGAPGDGQLFEIEANLAMYFNDSAGAPIVNKINAVCYLKLDDGTTQEVPLPGPAESNIAELPPYIASMPYDWVAQARATVPAGRTVVQAAVELSAQDNTGSPRTLGRWPTGSPSHYDLKITRLR